MGDVGYFDEAGRLWFCGRKSQRVRMRGEAGGGDLFSTPFEGVFNTHPQVARSALVGVERGGNMEPVMCIERTADGKRVRVERLRQELLSLAQRHEHTRIVRDFSVSSAISRWIFGIMPKLIVSNSRSGRKGN